MTSQSGGASVIPGLTSDGLTPGGIHVAGEETVAGALTSASLHTGAGTLTGALIAGDPAAVSVPSTHRIYGLIFLSDAPGNCVDGDQVVILNQSQGLIDSFTPQGALLTRSGALNGHDYQNAFIEVSDITASAQPSFRVMKEGSPVLELTTQKSITGALASVTDANAKAVLTSIIAALTGIKVAANNTT